MTKHFSPYATALAVSAALWALHCGTTTWGDPGNNGNGGSSSGGGAGGSGSGSSSSGGSSGSGSSSSGGSSGSSSGSGGSSSSGSGGSSGSGSGGSSGSGSGGSSGSSSGGSSGSSSGVVPGADACLPKQADNVAASVNPPGGLAPSKVPQFVMFGSDDNYYADGVDWLVKTAFAGKTNPDGTPAQITFFITSGGATSANGGVFTPGSVGQTEAQVLASWQNAYAAGHQLGNHTWDHDKSDGAAGNSYTAAQWQSEIDQSQSFLTSAGFPACELDGWRFPYLTFDDAGFQSFAGSGFLFDTSVEFGYNWWQPPGSTAGFGPGSPESGKHFWWPMTLDTGFPSDANSGFDPVETKGVGAHPGVWEFFAHVWNSPDPANPSAVRTVTGLDYNMWQRSHTNPGAGYDFCGTLKYTFEQKYAGNRSPFNVGLHSTIYSPDDPSQDTFFGNTADVRRAGLQCFIDYLFSGAFPDVRVVGFHKVIAWMRNPKAIH